MALKKCRGVFRLGENCFEKTVVRVRGGIEIGFFHGAEILSPVRRRQESFRAPRIEGRRKGEAKRLAAITSGDLFLPIKIPASFLTLAALVGISLVTPAFVVEARRKVAVTPESNSSKERA